MTTFKLRYVDRFRDRHGKVRYYFRRKHGPRFLLPGEPDSPEFIEAYREAKSVPPPVIGFGRHAHGSFAALADQYFSSTAFKRLRPTTQAVSRGIIERFVEQHGHRLVAQMKREHVDIIIAAKASKPAAANNLLKKLRMLIRFGIANRWRDSDPTLGIKKFREGEHHTWTDGELATFEAKWPLGTRERTAYAIHLYAGQRRGDVCRMTRADVGPRSVRVVQEKGGERLTIALHPKLRAALDAWPRKHVTLLYSEHGKQYTVESYGNLMADAIAAAGLPARCVLHGLRKAAGRRLAEAGCSAKEIAAVLGHKTLKEVERYTAAANQEKLAKAAILRLKK